MKLKKLKFFILNLKFFFERMKWLVDNPRKVKREREREKGVLARCCFESRPLGLLLLLLLLPCLGLIYRWVI